ncbi:MAG TPA: SDR family oxidoreductase [Pseudonocardia sp.]|nr:SDR family oxidoreductase [Pseudonocardia sp.]
MGEGLAGRVAFVTDGWYGTGAAVVEGLLADGATVGVGFSRPDPGLDEFAALHLDDPLTLHRGSLGVAEDCHRAVQDVVDRHGRIDVLVAMVNYKASGFLSARRPLGRLTEREWRRTLDVHLSGAFYLAQAAIEHMTAAGFGRILFVMGPAGVGDGHSHHATVRGALRDLTRELAREVAGSGVTVNRVQAGMVDDELLRELPEGVVEQACSKIPVGRLAQRAEVARVVGFLAHPDSGYLTGQSLAVDGGLTMEWM